MIEKAFSDEEKEFIKYINKESDGTSVANYLDRFLESTSVLISINDHAVIIKAATEGSILHCSPQETEDIKKKLECIENRLIKFMFFINYLELHYLITSFTQVSSGNNEISFGQCPIDSDYICYQVTDNSTIDLLIKYIDRKIMTTQTLMELEKRGFTSDEEVKKDNSNMQLYIFIISIIGVIIALLTWQCPKQTEHQNSNVYIMPQIQQGDSLVSIGNDSISVFRNEMLPYMLPYMR